MLEKPGPNVIILFMLNSAEYEFINVKMPIIVGTLTFTNWINTAYGSFKSRKKS